VLTAAKVGAGATLTLTGDVAAHATETSSSVTTHAKGDANGASTAVGAALALGFDRDDVLATTASDVTTAGAFELKAVGSASTATIAEASADGSPASGAPAPTAQNGTQRSFAGSLATNNGATTPSLPSTPP